MWLLRLPRVASVVPDALEDGRGHFLDRGLAVAAGHADDGHREARAPGGGGVAQRSLRVGNDNLRQRRCHRRVDHGTGRAGRGGGGDEIVGVEARPAKRDEQLAGLQRARVGGHAGVGAIGALERAATGFREFGQRAAHAPPPARDRSAVRNHLLVAERPALTAVDLVVLVPLAGNQHDVGRLRVGERITDGAGAIELDAKWLAGGNARGDVRGNSPAATRCADCRR